MKLSTSADQMCKGLHDVFKRFSLHTTRIEFEKTPDYDDWGFQFRNLFFEKSYKYHYKYD